MAIDPTKLIDVGTTANDGTGDPLRTAFTKANTLFTELWDDDEGDVNSVTAGTGISVNQTTGAVTVTNSEPNATHTGEVEGSGVLTITALAVTTGKIANDAVTADKLDNAINSEIAANTAKVTNANHTGEVTGATALTITSGAVTNAKMAANSVDSDQYVDGSIDTVHLAADVITQAKLATQFKTTDAKGSVSGTQTLDFGANQVFTATITASTTFGITNAEIGMVKDLYVTGSYDLLITNGKKVAGTYDGSVTNLIQIVAQTPTSFWYSISQEQV